MKIAVITGEESGDKLAASILRKLKNSTDNSIDLYGIGGKALDEIGIQKFHDISEINVMGIFEVLPKILQISKIINQGESHEKEINRRYCRRKRGHLWCQTA